MTKNEALRRSRLDSYLLTLGFTDSEVASLRRINSTLQRWHELECGDGNGMIERDETTGKPFWISYTRRYLGANDARMRSPVADRETGALRRLSKIMRDRETRLNLPHGGRNWVCDDGTVDIVEDGEVVRQNLPPGAAILETYIQTDPRGAALYILRPGDIPAGTSVESCYTRGVCVF
jgi:hypothetical protein